MHPIGAQSLIVLSTQTCEGVGARDPGVATGGTGVGALAEVDAPEKLTLLRDTLRPAARIVLSVHTGKGGRGRNIGANPAAQELSRIPMAQTHPSLQSAEPARLSQVSFSDSIQFRFP